jgi:hypothetical protein
MQPGDLNIFTQIALVVLVGLACKNAILIVEFAKDLEERGEKLFDAVIHACRMRLRPILMTSIAFCAGVIPLILGSGAGSEMRRAMGIAVFSGMVGVTLFGIFLTPGVLRAAAESARAPRRGRRGSRRPRTRRRRRRSRRAAAGAAAAACGRRRCLSPHACCRKRLPAQAAAIAAPACARGLRGRPRLPRQPRTLDAAFVNAGAAGDQRTAAGVRHRDVLARLQRPGALAAGSSARWPRTATSASPRRVCRRRARPAGHQAERLPNIGVGADVTRSLAPEVQFPGTTRGQRTVTVYDAGFTANWELDFFGRNRRASESAAAQVDASEAGVSAAHTAVAAEVARNYLELRGLQQRYEVARQSLVNQGMHCA